MTPATFSLEISSIYSENSLPESLIFSSSSSAIALYFLRAACISGLSVSVSLSVSASVVPASVEASADFASVSDAADFVFSDFSVSTAVSASDATGVTMESASVVF